MKLLKTKILRMQKLRRIYNLSAFATNIAEQQNIHQASGR
jgi:hypothetical protein